MEVLEQKVVDGNPERIVKKISLFTATKKELEENDYNSPEYKLFTFDFLGGEPAARDRDDFELITLIAETDREWNV